MSAWASASFSLSLTHAASRKRFDAPVVDAVGQRATVRADLRRRSPGRLAEAVELVQRSWPIRQVAEVEVRVAGMVDDRAPVCGYFMPWMIAP
jgi:hypothetical protein